VFFNNCVDFVIIGFINNNSGSKKETNSMSLREALWNKATKQSKKKRFLDCRVGAHSSNSKAILGFTPPRNDMRRVYPSSYVYKLIDNLSQESYIDCMLENIQLFFKQLNSKTEQLIAKILIDKSMSVSVAESCTGGLVSSRLTDIAGSSAYIKENYVTYANEAKMKILGVKEETLTNFGAVSEQCAKEMAEGLSERIGCDICLATTGIAGPAGATADKNVGLMYIAVKNKYKTQVKKIELNPKHKRKTMKYLFSQKALEFLLEVLRN
jgi:PncC family amidohydrolase